ncbi:MAG TPA: hypothetical protein VGH30_00615, partial [Jatrophihabitantaceae bacterium]
MREVRYGRKPAPALVAGFDAHRLEQPDAGHRIGPEQRVARNRAVGGEHGQIEVGVVERALGEPRSHLCAVAARHPVRPAAVRDQRVAVRRSDRARPAAGGHPRSCEQVIGGD